MKDKTIIYMNRIWNFDQGGEVDDISAFWDAGFYELVAKRLVDAGAVEPNCEEARDMIAAAEALTPDEEREMVTEALKELEVFQCEACNYVHYFDTTWLNPLDWINGGCQGCDRKHTLKAI